MMQKLAEVGTHEVRVTGATLTYMEDEAPCKWESLKIKCDFNAQISVNPTDICVTSSCAHKYCINMLMDWL